MLLLIFELETLNLYGKTIIAILSYPNLHEVTFLGLDLTVFEGINWLFFSLMPPKSVDGVGGLICMCAV